METRANNPDSLAVGLMAYYDNELPRYQSMLSKVFTIMDSTKQKEEFSGSTGITKLVDVGENGTYPYEDELEDFKTILTHKTFKRAIAVSEEQKEDDQYRTPESRTRSLAKAASQTGDFNGFSAFRNAFTSTSTSYGDAEELCSTSHDRLDGGTVRSNASSTNIALSEANLETGLIAMDEALDHKGEVIGNMGRGVILMVPIALRKKALEIVGSPLRSGTANNDLNYYALGDIDVFVNPWIGVPAGGSDTSWFIVRKQNNAMKFIWRKRPVSRVDVDDETDALKFKVRARFSYGWTDPIGEIWGSQGTGTGSYSS